MAGMNPDVFSAAPGQLIRGGGGPDGYWAYLPNPLPPPIPLDMKLVGTLSAADRALGELAGLARNLPNPHLLIGPFIRREAVLSSKIEGTQAEVRDLYAYQAGQVEIPGLRGVHIGPDVREVANYVDALEYGLDRLSSLPMSLRLIREIHGRLMAEVRGGQAQPGEFRRMQNWIGPPGATLATASYVPPPVPEMTEALSALEAYLHADDETAPLMRLAIIHYQFESIHPFLDGNGRVGRLLTTLLLVHWGILPLPLLYLSAYFEQHRQTYYDLLLGVSARGEWAEWTRFFLTGVAEMAIDAQGRARKLLDLQREFRDGLERNRASAVLLRLADALFTAPVLTIPMAQELLEVTYRSAKQNVDKLVDAGILAPVGDQRYGKVYAAAAVLAAIGE